MIMMYVRSSAMVVASMCARACAVETGINQMRSGRVAAGPCPPSFVLLLHGGMVVSCMWFSVDRPTLCTYES